jgi:hypothetical protein
MRLWSSKTTKLQVTVTELNLIPSSCDLQLREASVRDNCEERVDGLDVLGPGTEAEGTNQRKTTRRRRGKGEVSKKREWPLPTGKTQAS